MKQLLMYPHLPLIAAHNDDGKIKRKKKRFTNYLSPPPLIPLHTNRFVLGPNFLCCCCCNSRPPHWSQPRHPHQSCCNSRHPRRPGLKLQADLSVWEADALFRFNCTASAYDERSSYGVKSPKTVLYCPSETWILIFFVPTSTCQLCLSKVRTVIWKCRERKRNIRVPTRIIVLKSHFRKKWKLISQKMGHFAQEIRNSDFCKKKKTGGKLLKETGICPSKQSARRFMPWSLKKV